jgi:hypothetical protein
VVYDLSNLSIRKPMQKRSIEKKIKIIKAGLDLFCKKGFYNTNTVEIAKTAGVPPEQYTVISKTKKIFTLLLLNISSIVTLDHY